MIIDQETLYRALYILCQRIEKCGASVELTNAVSLASDLLSSVGNEFNKPNNYSLNRVKEVINSDNYWKLIP